MGWNLSCPEWESKIRKGLPPIPDLPLFRGEADRAVAIFNRLKLPDVPGTPTMAEAGGDWFRDAFVAPLMGSFDPLANVRMIREIFGLVPKKNSKTTNGSALILTALLMNRRPRAEFIYVGPTQEVAQLAYDQTVGAIILDATLAKRFHVQEHKKQITDRTNRAKLKIKSFDPAVMTGVKPAGVLLDEIHAVSQSDADRVIGQARGGLESQPEGFLIIITTQSERPPAGVFRAELMKARAIRGGDVRMANVPMLPVLYEFPTDIVLSGAWRDSANWWMVLPNLGRSIQIESLKQAYAAADFVGEEEVRRWASQHLNIEIGLALRSDRWVGADFWEGRANQTLTLDTLLARSEVVTVGIDGGGLDDLFGLAILGRDAETREWLLWSHAWAHSSVLERRQSEAQRLRDFERVGELTILANLGGDIEQIAEIVARVDDSGSLAHVGLDTMGVGAVVDALAERGVDGDRVIGIPQGWQLTHAIKTCERKLADGTLTHAGQAIMAWAVGNARVEPRGNAITITKQAAGTAKIDPLMAALNAVALMAKNPEARKTTSVFDAPDFDEVMQSGILPERDDGIDMAILANPAHPRWHEMRERFEANLAAKDEFEDAY